ncbi:MAG: DUF433 domain-containing protein [Acidobacteriota bacterium]
MAKDYIEKREGGYYVKDTRVSLDSVVCSYLRGESPEGIAESFPALNLEQIFGALAFYTANQQTIDQYLNQEHAEFEVTRQQSQRTNPAFYARLAEARQKVRAQ